MLCNYEPVTIIMKDINDRVIFILMAQKKNSKFMQNYYGNQEDDQEKKGNVFLFSIELQKEKM